MRKTTILILFIAFFQIAFAQSGTIKGSAKTIDGKAAEFVNIILAGTHWVPPLI